MGQSGRESSRRFLLRCVDPDDVQVTEVDALLVEESGAGAAFGAQVMLR